jgi:hypothetical protein
VKTSFDVPDLKTRPFKVKKPMFFQPAHVSPRLHAQMGVFSIHPDLVVPYDSPFLQKLVLAADERFNFQVQLDTLGFNRATMFPDIDGLAQQLGWRYAILEDREDDDAVDDESEDSEGENEEDEDEGDE